MRIQFVLSTAKGTGFISSALNLLKRCVGMMRIRRRGVIEQSFEKREVKL